MLSKFLNFTFAVLLAVVALIIVTVTVDAHEKNGLFIKGKNLKRKLHLGHKNEQAIPTSFDWRDHGFNLPVGNQGQCGGGTVGWTMAELFSGVDFVTNKRTAPIPLSAAQLIECRDVDDGCCGGMPDSTVANLINATGGYIATAASYPFVGPITNGQPGKCRPSGWTVGTKVTGYVNLPDNEVALQEYLMKNGPVAVVVDPTGLENYSGGVISGKECAFTYYEHMLLLVGWGQRYVQNSPKGMVDVWYAMNSWGTDWGELGFVAFERGVNCSGIAGYGRSATVAKV